jgi:hypothetical protein
VAATNWDAWRFLLGEWAGAGGGTPGQGGGDLSIQFDLQGQVLVRRNHVDFPATAERPAFSHDDLTIIYPETAGSTRAEYFDNEGHVIHYAVTMAADKIMMTSEPGPSTPRFRTTYWKGENETAGTRFEIAPPGKPEDFAVYIEGILKRK